MLLELALPARMTFLPAMVDSVVGMQKIKIVLVLPASRMRLPVVTERRTK